jgi:hypothetical protein
MNPTITPFTLKILIALMIVLLSFRSFRTCQWFTLITQTERQNIYVPHLVVILYVNFGLKSSLIFFVFVPKLAGDFLNPIPGGVENFIFPHMHHSRPADPSPACGHYLHNKKFPL